MTTTTTRAADISIIPGRCPVCKTTIRTELLMCSRHWFMVPRSLREAVGRQWRLYQLEECTLVDLRTVQREAAFSVFRLLKTPNAAGIIDLEYRS